MDEDEELFREMNEEDDFYMGDRDDQDDDCDGQYHRSSSNGSSMGCLVMLPLLVGTLTFMVILIAGYI